MIEVVAFAGPFAHAGKHRISRVLDGDIADQLHHVDGLAHAGATEQAHLATLGERAEQVDDLDTGFQQLGRARLVLIARCWLMDGAVGVGLHRPFMVDRYPQHVHDPTQSGRTHWHRDWRPGVGDDHVALQPFGRSHGDGADHAVAQLLLHFQDQPVFIETQRVVDLGHRPAGELDVHHRADDLHHIARTHALGSSYNLFHRVSASEEADTRRDLTPLRRHPRSRPIPG